MRTYSGHSTAAASNALYRKNIGKGQTGLSIAFDLPTQTGYDADHPLAAGEVGKVGVPISSIEDMDVLLDGIPLDEMNTSMTINAPAPWLLALYIALAERRGIARSELRGTTQNDIIKEYLSRGTHIFPPAPSMDLTTQLIEFTVDEVPRWNPINICSYHLQEAGATPVQEVAYTLANAIAVLDAIDVDPAVFPRVVGRVAFFCNAGMRFIEEMCKMRVFTRLWDRITRERYGVEDPKLRRFRCGVQVNSLGLTAAQPENNITRIVLESLGVLLSRDARTRALQLPAWNEALGLPRPWDQQWSLRIQQILAYETDLLEYPDLFEGSPVIEAKVAEMEAAAWAEIETILERGGAVAAVSSGYMKQALVESNLSRMRAVASGERTVVGLNRFESTEPSPLLEDDADLIVAPSLEAEREQIERLRAHRAQRDDSRVANALAGLKTAIETGVNLMPASIECAHAGVTTGEWTDVLRQIHGDYRAPTGIEMVRHVAGGDDDGIRERVAGLSETMGRRPKMLIGKPGLDGHSNGAEQLALAARSVGFEVVYQGIRLTPEQIVEAAVQEDVHIVGLSILSGSHMTMAPAVAENLSVPVVVGGIIPSSDAVALRELGVAAVYTPSDHRMDQILSDLVDLVEGAQQLR
jgi:(2R)-ethylmalonyl-CoA mutase